MRDAYLRFQMSKVRRRFRDTGSQQYEPGGSLSNLWQRIHGKARHRCLFSENPFGIARVNLLRQNRALRQTAVLHG